MIKLIATDMDGTLLNNWKKVGKNFEEIISQLNEKDVIFALASGRNYQRIKDKFKKMNLDLMYISDNGNYIEYKGEVLNKSTLEKKDIISLAEFLKEKAYCKYSFSNEHDIYTDSKFVHKLGRYCFYKNKFVENVMSIKEDIIKCSILVPSVFHGQMLSELKSKYPHLHISRSSKHTIDINSGEMNKGKAVELLKEKFALKYEEVMVFGDYLNDLEMMGVAYYSYAMKNAHKEIKEKANFLAPSNKKNGVLKVIENVVLNKNK
ncbi:MAG: HAD family phosphatase [Clostridium sp.]|nr:HAD family phosphatase [Clostridium sp.]